MGKFFILDQVTYCYPGSEKTGVCQVNLALKAGEFLAVLGANGSGKSTLARLCCGLLKPTSGQVLVDGFSTSKEEDLCEIYQQVGMVFQHPDNQFVASTVETEVAFGLENRTLSSQEIRAAVDEGLTYFHLDDLKTAEPHYLSGGEKRLLSLADLWVLKPKLLLLDEPLAMLDPGARKRINLRLEELRAAGQTIIWFTHSLEEVMAADQVMVMANGRMVWLGSPLELLRLPVQARAWGVSLPPVSQLALDLGISNPGLINLNELVSEIWKLI